MPNTKEPKCRLCRREGEKLFLKGARCNTQKCAMIKRNFPPGLHGLTHNRRISEFGKQLRAKQKAKRIYGIREGQFYGYYEEADRREGVTGDSLIFILESRLDNVIYRAGLAESRSAARQLVTHGHFLVNGKRVDVPSLLVKVGDEIAARPKAKKSIYFQNIIPFLKKHKAPSWLTIDSSDLKIKIVSELTKEKVDTVIDTQAIIEFYSK